MKKSIGRDITYNGQEKLSIKSYSDSDWVGDKKSQKSILGFFFILNEGLVSWCFKQQSIVAFSSTETEFIALTFSAKEAMWLCLLLTKLGHLELYDEHAKIFVKEGNSSAQTLLSDAAVWKEEEENSTITTISLKNDNQSFIALAHNSVFYSKTKHINIQHHYIWDDVSSGRIKLIYVPNAKMIADNLTKLLTHAKFHGFL